MANFLTLFGEYALKRGENWRMDNAEVMDAYEAECKTGCMIGPRTTELVFKANDIKNLSDLQAVLDAVEKAFAQLQVQAQDVTARMENGLDWFIEAVFIDESQPGEERRLSGRLKFLLNGQPYYEGELSPVDFMSVFLYGCCPAHEKPAQFRLSDALSLDGFGDGARTGVYSGVKLSKTSGQPEA